MVTRSRWTLDAATASPHGPDALRRAIRASTWSRTGLLAALAGLIVATSFLCPGSALAHGTFHERLDSVNREIGAAPGRSGHYVRRAELYRRHGDWDAALADLDRAEVLTPSLREIDYFRGRVFLDSDRAAAAEAALARFLSHAPDHPAARAAHARALAKLGRHLEAAHEFTRAIECQPVPIPEDYIDRARALAEAGDTHVEEAVRGLDDGLARIGPTLTLELAAVDLELGVGRLDEALARLDRVAARSRLRALWLARRGEILESAGRLEESRAAFQLALTEISQLPAHRRKTAAIVQLERRVRQAIGRIEQSSRHGG